MYTFSERHMNVYHGHLTVYHSIMKNVMWRHFDQSAKQLIVGHTKIHYVILTSRNSVLEEYSIRRFAVIQDEIRLRA